MKIAIAAICVLGAINVAVCKPSKESYLEPVTNQLRVFEDVINATINSLAGIAARFDPLDIDHQEVTDLLGHHGEITNLHIEGFSNFVASHIKLSGLITWTLELILELPAASGSVEQWLAEGKAFYGNGTASAQIENLKVSIVAKINPLAVALKSIRITPSIGSAEVSITGLYNDDELSQKVSDTITDFLNFALNENTSLHDKISQIVKTVIDEVLDRILG